MPQFPWPREPDPWWRSYAWGAVWAMTVGAVFAALDWPIPYSWPVAFMLGFIVPTLCRRHVLRNAWFRWKHREERQMPLVLDEDGTVHHPPLVPYEEALLVLSKADGGTHGIGRPIAAKVITRDGRVLAEADWSSR